MTVGTPHHPLRQSQTITRGFRVTVRPRYLRDESDPSARRYIFAYRITIANEGGPCAKLLSRHWRIVDAHGREDEVIGDGVVGATPLLAPGESFEYESFCPLPTAWGTMEGTYTMRGEDGEQFKIAVPRFYLVSAEPAGDRR